MKRILITFITVFSMCCLVACGSETTNDVSTGNNNEVVVNNNNDNPVTTAEATAEPTKEPSSEVADVEPTEEPVAEATPEPTEEPILYPGIDMESDLPGEEWVETFVGIIEEPKIVVFSDETGRKEIFENDSVVKVDPDTDMIGVYLPEDYTRINKRTGIGEVENRYDLDYFVYFKLKAEDTRSEGVQTAALYVEFAGEEIELPFVLVPQ